MYRVRRLDQPPPECLDGDLTFRLGGALELSDVDADGIAELSFAVLSACITDVSAKEVAVSVWEGGAAYRLEGQTVWWDSESVGVTVTPVLDHAVGAQPALQTLLEDRYAALIEAERKSMAPDATVTVMPLR